jgi:hypothetical protein
VHRIRRLKIETFRVERCEKFDEGINGSPWSEHARIDQQLGFGAAHIFPTVQALATPYQEAQNSPPFYRLPDESALILSSMLSLP